MGSRTFGTEFCDWSSNFYTMMLLKLMCFFSVAMAEDDSSSLLQVQTDTKVKATKQEFEEDVMALPPRFRKKVQRRCPRHTEAKVLVVCEPTLAKMQTAAPFVHKRRKVHNVNR